MKSYRLLSEKKTNTYINSFSVGRRPMFCSCFFFQFVCRSSCGACFYLPILKHMISSELLDAIINCVGLINVVISFAGEPLWVGACKFRQQIDRSRFLIYIGCPVNASTCRKSSFDTSLPNQTNATRFSSLARSFQVMENHRKSISEYGRTRHLPLFPF